MKVQIISDKSSWMNNYNYKLKEELTKRNNEVEIIHSVNEIKKGDIALLLSCYDILDSSILSLNKHNLVVHESCLPKGKGWSPLTWQIIEGKNSIPICIFEATTDCDSGEIYYLDHIELDGNELVDELREKQAGKTLELILRFFDNIPDNVGQIQVGNESFYPRRTLKDSELNIYETIDQQFNLLRVVDNEAYPAYFIKNGQKYLIKIEKTDIF